MDAIRTQRTPTTNHFQLCHRKKNRKKYNTRIVFPDWYTHTHRERKFIRKVSKERREDGRCCCCCRLPFGWRSDASGRSTLFTVELLLLLLLPPLLLLLLFILFYNPISLRMHPVGGYKRQRLTTHERPANNRTDRQKERRKKICRLSFRRCAVRSEFINPIVVVVVVGSFTTEADLQLAASWLGTLASTLAS